MTAYNNRTDRDEGWLMTALVWKLKSWLTAGCGFVPLLLLGMGLPLLALSRSVVCSLARSIDRAGKLFRSAPVLAPAAPSFRPGPGPAFPPPVCI